MAKPASAPACLVEGSPLQVAALASFLGLLLAWEGEGPLLGGLFVAALLFAFPRRNFLLPVLLSLSFLYGSWRFAPPKVLGELPLGQKVRFEAEILKPPEALSGYKRFEVEILRLLSPAKEVHLKARLYAPAGVRLRVGEVFEASGYLRRPRGFWNPFGYEADRALAARGVYLSVSLSRRGPPEVLYQTSGFYLQRVRARLLAFASGLSDPARGLFEALVLGEKASLPPSFSTAFRVLGLSHLLAVSGLHLALLAGLVLLVVRFLVWIFPELLLLWPRAYWGLGGAVLVGGLYVLLSGPSPSALRAYVMLLVFFAAYLLKREPRVLNTLALAVLLILLVWPKAVGTLSFRLSVTAVLGLILAARWKRRLPWPRNQALAWIAEVFYYSSAAVLFTAPWSLLSFGGVPLLAPFTNLLALPLFAAVILPLEILAVLTLPFSAGLARWWATIPGLLLAPVFYLKGAVFTPPLPVGAFLVGCLPALGALFSREHRYLWLLLALGLEGVFWGCYRSLDLVAVLDVGQGSAAVAKVGAQVLLFDAGPKRGHFDTGAFVVAPSLRKLGLTQVDLAIISHPQADHLGGLWGLSREVPVREILVGSFEDQGLYQTLRRDFGLRVHVLTRPETRSWAGARLFLLPGRPQSPLARANQEGLVARLCLEDSGWVLFPGDIGFRRERRLLKEGHSLRAKVLVLPHHGARSSASPAFLEAVAPKLALSSARSRYHPSQATLARLKRLGIPHLSTKEVGAITILAWGGKFWVCTEAERRKHFLPWRALWPLWPVGCRLL